MHPRLFLELAELLLDGNGPAACRTVISRAYYAVFHTVQEFFELMGFAPPKRDYHIIVQRRLLASGDNELANMGSDLGDLHQQRIRADYRLADKGPEGLRQARAVANEARRMIDILVKCPIYSDRWERIK